MINALRRLPAAFLLLSLFACGGDDEAASGGADVAEADRYGGTAVVGNISDIPDINPLTSTDATSNNLQMFVLYSPLVRYNEKFEAEPYAAESWELNEDTSTITFHLRQDLYWHDGRKTTAEDWKFSYDLARDPQTAFPNTAFWTHYGEAAAVDSFTFRVEMEPHADFIDPWRAFAAVPKHLLEGIAPAEIKNHPYSTSKPIGNGPFKFVSRQPGQSWTFGAFEQFPEALGGRPYLDRIVYRNIPEPTTLLTELITGNVDYYLQVTPEQAQRIKTAANARLATYPDRYFTLIGWNQRREMFKDPKVRRALTMAINRQAIVDGILYGYGQVANSTIPPFYWQYDEGAGADLAYDTLAAKRLLAEAGWTDRDGDGTIENAQGTPFRFNLITNQGNQERKDITEVVQAELRHVGIAVQPQILEWGTLLDKINDPVRRDFDAVLIGWVTEFRIDDTDLFSCSKMDDPYQWVSYCNRDADRLLDTLPKIVDREGSRALWQQYQRRISQDQPYTFLYYVTRRSGVAERLRNVQPDARGDWVGAKDWYIRPDMRREARTASQ